MVHLSKILRSGGPTPYFTDSRAMIGCGKEVFNLKGHHYPLLTVHAVTIGGCIICALYMGRNLFFGSDVIFNKESKAFPWMIKSNQHQYKFLSFNLKYKELHDHPNRPQGFNLYREKDKVVMTSKDYWKLNTGKKEEEE